MPWFIEENNRDPVLVGNEPILLSRRIFDPRLDEIKVRLGSWGSTTETEIILSWVQKHGCSHGPHERCFPEGTTITKDHEWIGGVVKEIQKSNPNFVGIIWSGEIKPRITKVIPTIYPQRDPNEPYYPDRLI